MGFQAHRTKKEKKCSTIKSIHAIASFEKQALFSDNNGGHHVNDDRIFIFR